jgi:hypothetical protein
MHTICIHTHNQDIFTDSIKANKLFLGRHFLLKSRPLIWISSIIQQYRWRWTNRWKLLEEIKPRSLAGKRHLLLLQSQLTANKRPHNSSSNFCCSQLLTTNALTHLYASFNGSKPLRHFCYRRGSLLRVWLRFLRLLSFFKRIFYLEFKEAGQE